MLIVQYMSPDSKSYLAEVLGWSSKLLIKEMVDGEKPVRNIIYTPKIDKQMMVNSDGTIILSSAEKVQFTWPVADVLCVTMAIAFRKRAIVVIMTGAGQDSAIGALLVKNAGGKTKAQEDLQSRICQMV